MDSDSHYIPFWLSSASQRFGLIFASLFLGAHLEAQVPMIPMTPARAPAAASGSSGEARASALRQLGGMTPARPIQPKLKDEEVELLRKDYNRLTLQEREAMVATYKDLGINLLEALGLAVAEDEAAATKATATTAKNDLLKGVKKLNFARTADKVLEARAQIGLKAVPMPSSTAPIDEQVQWLHRNVLAGEWQSLQSFLKERAGSDAAEIYAHVLQSTNQGDPGLLPEEILAISEACPAELTEWQLTLLAQLLKTAASRSSTGLFWISCEQEPLFLALKRMVDANELRSFSLKQRSQSKPSPTCRYSRRLVRKGTRKR